VTSNQKKRLHFILSPDGALRDGWQLASQASPVRQVLVDQHCGVLHGRQVSGGKPLPAKGRLRTFPVSIYKCWASCCCPSSLDRSTFV